ncbi:hypothetical protein [Halomonas caseinilytica]|uniref:DNA (Cytosine-5)-methyltransferase 1 n=1 Tax=Halomonas caseinilytica TaxID=438744 RepID=A0A1M6XR80_9GAMM|nr:hypothetical protein [Halomonas caseinilytica]SHL08454.1 DNA (cytosine-5)-methyltransferase 1 [Halomonas caseinilytica]
MIPFAIGYAAGVISVAVVAALLIAKGAKDLNHRGEVVHSYDPKPGINTHEMPSQERSEVLPKGDRNAAR